MTNIEIEKSDLQSRFDAFRERLDGAEKKFAERSSLPAGAHMGHLQKLKERCETLGIQIEEGDDNLWQSMKQNWNEDLDGLAQALENAIAYEEEEFRKGQG